jgi:hypothetical protein
MPNQVNHVSVNRNRSPRQKKTGKKGIERRKKKIKLEMFDRVYAAAAAAAAVHRTLHAINRKLLAKWFVLASNLVSALDYRRYTRQNISLSLPVGKIVFASAKNLLYDVFTEHILSFDRKILSRRKNE